MLFWQMIYLCYVDFGYSGCRIKIDSIHKMNKKKKRKNKNRTDFQIAKRCCALQLFGIVDTHVLNARLLQSYSHFGKRHVSMKIVIVTLQPVKWNKWIIRHVTAYHATNNNKKTPQRRKKQRRRQTYMNQLIDSCSV